MLLLAQFLCLSNDVLSTQTELLQQSSCGAGVTELVVDTDARDLDGVVLSQVAANSLTQATDDGVLFSGDDLATSWQQPEPALRPGA